jgi:hypothetical protein
MQRRLTSRSPKKQAKRIPSPKKPCSNCLATRINQLHLSRSLYRKYSFSQNHTFLARVNQLTEGRGSGKGEGESTRDSGEEAEEEFLSRYHRAASRRAALARVKEVYRLHRDLPRLFQPGLSTLIAKCHHRKRLVDYFKLAKTLGIRVDSLAFSSFMLSLHLARTLSNTYSQVLDETERTEGSEGVERGLLKAIDRG